MPNDAAAMPQPAEPIAPQVSESTRSQLVAAFSANPDAIIVDNSEKPDAEVEVAEVTEEKPSEEKEAEKTEADEKETSADAEEESEEEAEEDEGEKKYLTKEEIDEQFSRNNSKKLRALAAQYSEEAVKGNELRSKLGGEPFIEPVTKIAQALQADNVNVQAIFEGVLETRAEDGLLPLLSHAVYSTFSNADDKSEFGIAMTLIRDEALRQYFGVDLPPEEIQQLAEWRSMGWFDTLKKWTDAGAVDEDELTELIEVNNNPRLKTLAAQNAELKRQLESHKSHPGQVDNSRESDIESGLVKFSEDQISTVLTDTIWKNSPLKDAPTDSPEIKEEKGFERDRLKEKVFDTFRKAPQYKNLLADAKLQKSGTAHWQAKFVNLVKSAIDETAPDKKRAEDHIAKLIGTTRNGKLAAQVKAKEPLKDITAKDEKLQPTVSQPLIAPNQPKTQKEIRKNLQEAFRAAEGV